MSDGLFVGSRPVSDGDQLRLLADLFDRMDDVRGVPLDSNGREVQRDLRRIARRLDDMDGRLLPTADDVLGQSDDH